MKLIMMIVLLVAVGVHEGRAQTFREWWRQKETKIEYLLAQVGALQAYIGEVKKGFAIVEGGLRTIHAIKDGDFRLHRDFISGLSGISPRMADYARIADIATLQLRLVRQGKKQLDRVREGGIFTAKELDYLSGVYARLFARSAENLEELMELVTAGGGELGDAERLERIAALREETKEQCAFADWFGGETELLAAARSRDLAETDRLKGLTGK